jgi:hypothetical protein
MLKKQVEDLLSANKKRTTKYWREYHALKEEFKAKLIKLKNKFLVIRKERGILKATQQNERSLVEMEARFQVKVDQQNRELEDIPKTLEELQVQKNMYVALKQAFDLTTSEFEKEKTSSEKNCFDKEKEKDQIQKEVYRLEKQVKKWRRKWTLRAHS